MKKAWRVCITAGIMAAAMSFGSFAGQWKQNDVGWWYDNGDGTWPAGVWQWIDGNQDGLAESYYFDANGYMLAGTTTPDGYTVNEGGAWTVNGVVQTKQTGMSSGSAAPAQAAGTWKQDEAGRWYFENADGTRRTSGWHWLDGNQDGIAECYYFDAEGWMAANTATPDGYTVDGNGAWIVDGIVQTKMTGISGPGGVGTGTVRRSGGGGGGGGSSSGGGGSSSGGGGSSSGGSSQGQDDEQDSDDYYEDDAWKDYQDSSVSHAANDFITGNAGMMSAEEREAVNAAIAAFTDEYITDDMTDFEKEILIIKWLVENCEYESAEGWSRSTAYSCIVEGRAQCAGYADAFLQTAKACGLDARYVYNTDHAWNLIELDGSWYHVDVTWEDPVIRTENDPGYGFEKLRNEYINLTDEEIQKIRSHKTWTPRTIKASGTEYNYFVVEHYLQTGEIDLAAEEKNEESFRKLFQENDGIVYTTVEETAEKIVSKISKAVDERENVYKAFVSFDSYSIKNTTDSLEVYDLCDEIESIVTAALNEKYKDVVTGEFSVHLFRGETQKYQKLYVTATGSLRYKAGQGKKTTYTIHFFDINTEKEVGTQTGTGELGQEIPYVFPAHYGWITNKSHEIHSGDAWNNGKSFTIRSAEPLDMDVMVNLKELAYKVTFVDRDTEEIVGTQEGYGAYNQTTELKFDTEKYSLISITVNEGEARRYHNGFIIESRKPVDITAFLEILIPYKVTYIDENGTVIGTQEGSHLQNGIVDWEFDQEKYSLVSYTVKQGKADKRGSGFSIITKEPAELTVVLKEKSNAEASAQTKTSVNQTSNGLKLSTVSNAEKEDNP